MGVSLGVSLEAPLLQIAEDEIQRLMLLRRLH
jgi:hypothetical protein